MSRIVDMLYLSLSPNEACLRMLKDLKKELAASVEDYLAFCAERDEPLKSLFQVNFR